MNQRSDIARLLRHWMDDGPTRMPDRIVDVVADRISVQRQRRSWRLLWRLPMSPLFKLGIAAAAVLAIAVVGWNLLPGGSGPGGVPSPTPSPTQTQPSASPTGPLALRDGQLTGGRYRFLDSPGPTVLADVPTGWIGVPDWAVIGPQTQEPPTGVAVAMLLPDGLHSDPCNWDPNDSGSWPQPGDIEVGPAAIDLVEALHASTAYTTTTPSPVTFGDYEGWEIGVQLPADLKLATCDKEGVAPRYFIFGGEGGGMYAQGGGTDRDRWHLFIVDVDGARVVVNLMSYPGTPAADLDAAQTIVDSIEFVP